MDWKRAKVLVTGGASFIGSHLVEALLEKGAACVRVADDLSSGNLQNLAAVRDDIEIFEGDLRHVDFAGEASRGCDVVFHLAADHGGRGYISTHPANCAGNMALDNIVFDAAVKNGAERITFASSACVYPTDIQLGRTLLREDMVSFAERGGAFADEEYGWAKLMGEMSLRAHHKQHGVKAASGRISSAYGPRENETHAVVALIAKAFIKQTPFEVWGDGEQTRGFTYVGDIVDGLILACEHVEDGSAINIGTDEFISLNRVAEAVLDEFDWRPPEGIRHLVDRPVGVVHRALDGSVAKQRAGWAPKVSFEEGLRQTIEWYVANNEIRDVAERLDRTVMQRK